MFDSSIILQQLKNSCSQEFITMENSQKEVNPTIQMLVDNLAKDKDSSDILELSNVLASSQIDTGDINQEVVSESKQKDFNEEFHILDK